MSGLASLILPPAAGWVWLRALGVLPTDRHAMARVLHLGLAMALGFGASSLMYFLLCLAGIAHAAVLAACEIALLAIGAALAIKQRARPSTPSLSQRWAFLDGLLLLGLALLLCLAGAIVANSYSAAPHGRWDAWAIWNLRARYMASEGSWRNAVSPLLTESHPGYPLGTPSLIARTWVYGGRDFNPAVPAAIAALCALATLLTLIGAVGVIRGPTLGLLAGCVLLSAQVWVAEIGSQYADVPLGLYFAAAFALLAIAAGAEDKRAAILAGVLAGLGALVKNEGLAFAGVLLVALGMTSHGRRQWRGFAIGLGPALALALAFKFFLAPADASLEHGIAPMAARAADLSRWGAIAAGLASHLWTLGDWYAHPALLAAGVVFFYRPPREMRPAVVAQAATLWIAAALLLAVDMAAYLVTPIDLKWQIDTSLDRVLIQILPAALLGVFLAAISQQNDRREAPSPGASAQRKPGKRSARAGAV